MLGIFFRRSNQLKIGGARACVVCCVNGWNVPNNIRAEMIAMAMRTMMEMNGRPVTDDEKKKSETNKSFISTHIRGNKGLESGRGGGGSNNASSK